MWHTIFMMMINNTKNKNNKNEDEKYRESLEGFLHLEYPFSIEIGKFFGRSK